MDKQSESCLKGQHRPARRAIDALFEAHYLHLKKIAHKALSGFYGDSDLTATVLVNECYLRLHSTPAGRDLDKSHFVHLAARCMRFHLVDLLRQKQCDKRQARETLLHVSRITGEECLLADMLDLDRALNRLHVVDPSLVELVELRLFLGLTLREIGQLKDISLARAHRQWTMAKALLSNFLGCDDGVSM